MIMKKINKIQIAKLDWRFGHPQFNNFVPPFLTRTIKKAVSQYSHKIGFSFTQYQ